MIEVCERCGTKVISTGGKKGRHRCEVSVRQSIHRDRARGLLSEFCLKCEHYGDHDCDGVTRTGCGLLTIGGKQMPCRTFDHLLSGGGCLADPPLFPPVKAQGSVTKLTAPPITPTVRETYRCDVVIPYGANGYPFLRDSIASILNQSFVEPIIHLANDGVTYDPIGIEFARLPNVRLYQNTDGPTGPYVIYNRIMHHMETDAWANQDADDISLPMRLFKSLRLIHEDGYDIVGGSMEQFVDYRFATPSMLSAVRKRPIHICGRQYSMSPSGNIINSTMVIRKSVYEESNGMANWLAGADSEFIERCVIAGRRCAAMQDIVALRRLNQASLSNGKLEGTGHGTDYRKWIYEQTQASIRKQRQGTDHSIGGLADERDSDKLVRVS